MPCNYLSMSLSPLMHKRPKYSISQEICTRFCCALLCCGYAIVRLPQCQCSKPDGYGKISQCITTTKHSKAKTVCIFLGIYCKTLKTANNPLEWTKVCRPGSKSGRRDLYFAINRPTENLGYTRIHHLKVIAATPGLLCGVMPTRRVSIKASYSLYTSKILSVILGVMFNLSRFFFISIHPLGVNRQGFPHTNRKEKSCIRMVTGNSAPYGIPELKKNCLNFANSRYTLWLMIWMTQ